MFLSMVLRMTMNRIILEWTYLISYVKVMITQAADHWTGSFFFESIVRPLTNGFNQVYESSGVVVGPRVHFWFMDLQKWGMMGYGSVVELIDMGMKTWHFSASVFVDQHVPIILSGVTKVIGWIHGHVIVIVKVVEEYRVEMESMEIVSFIRGHWICVLIWEWYLVYIDPLVSRFSFFVHVVYVDWDLVVQKGKEAILSIISKLKI